MNITILCSSENHPINPWLDKWMARHSNKHSVNLSRSKKELIGGDILFLISCSEIVTSDERQGYNNTLVIHASDLPKGRGWSPHVWEIINDKSEITLSLLEAADKVDSGDIWKKTKIFIPKTDLFDQINERIFGAELELMDFAIMNYGSIKIVKQDTQVKPTYYKKRSQQDSEIDINESIGSQFNLIRICDPERYPAFFYYNGQRYNFYIETSDDD